MLSVLVALVWFGRIHARLAALAHEAAHRLLFSNRRLNDVAGTWLAAYPTLIPLRAYRRAHLAHHRAEFGPDEPDLALYVGYPISRASFGRKLLRDISGRTGAKLALGQLRWLHAPDSALRAQAFGILAAQAGLLLAGLVAGVWWAYLLWLVSWLTVWRVINRLRSIAEHGGLHASSDRRETTHSVRQHALARLVLVPHHIGWHLAHHVDPGVPHHRLPELHTALTAAGYVPTALEYPNYRALWAALASR